MNGSVDLDGQVVPAHTVAAATDDVAFFAGRGLYETLLADAGRLAFPAAHFDRLRTSASELGLGEPPPDEELTARIQRLLARCDLRDTAARINLRWTGHSLLIRARPTRPDLEVLRRRGASVITERCPREAASPARHKWLDRPTLIRARARAKSERVEEILLLDAQDRLLEGASSSVFCVIGDRLSTPPVDGRILPGVTRSVICQIASARGMGVYEEAIRRTELLDAREVFLTSAVRMVVPVISIDGSTIGSGESGVVTQRLADELRWRAFETSNG